MMEKAGNSRHAKDGVPGDDPDKIEAAAARWVSRLTGGPLRPDERRDLEGWLAAHPDHQAAFDYARATWAELAALRDAPGSLIDDVVPPSRVAIARQRRAVRKWRPEVRARIAALAACVALAVGLGIFWFGDPTTMLLADYRTAPAEIRSFVLPDGSVADLAPASALALRFNDRERRIDLLAGTVYVTAAPMTEGERRPFLVQAADGSAKALGTQFMVDRLPDSVQVTVARHRVEVALAATADRAGSVLLTPGLAVRYGEGRGFGAVRTVDLGTATAWRRGRLIFDRVPLSTVVATLNRYRRGRIVIANPDLAERTVSGMFETARLENTLDQIARELGAQSVAVPPFVTLLF